MVPRVEDPAKQRLQHRFVTGRHAPLCFAELEDLYLAEQRLVEVRAGRSKVHTLEEVERDLGLAN